MQDRAELTLDLGKLGCNNSSYPVHVLNNFPIVLTPVQIYYQKYTLAALNLPLPPLAPQPYDRDQWTCHSNMP